MSAVFRYKEDRIPVLTLSLLTLLDVTLYFSVNETWVLALYWAAMIVPKGKACAWNHHHQHLSTFRSGLLNRLLEFAYALHTGATTHLWHLHHVLGHHLNYLDQTRDESRWRRNSGTTMGEVEYTLNVAFTSFYRAYRVGRRHPGAQQTFLTFSALTFAVVGLLAWYRFLPALLLFILPMLSGLILTSWATYMHHSNLETADPFRASRNNINPWYNLFTGNLGYHTAHHYKQGVHWSRLPELHEQIKDRIPPELNQSAAF
jgi:fatty acid desaturase